MRRQNGRKICVEWSQVRSVGRQLIAAQPSELVVGNIVRRVLFIIREEHATVVVLSCYFFCSRFGALRRCAVSVVHILAHG